MLGPMAEEGGTPGVELSEEQIRVLSALVRAYQDSIHPDIRAQGIDERDLAFEAGLLSPHEVEMTIYATQKRGRILRLLREMGAQGWVETEVVPPQGAYHVFLLDAGVQVLRESLRPWWSRLWDRLRSRRTGGPPAGD